MTLRLVVLALGLAVSMAGPAMAQVPNIQIYSVGTYDQAHIGCYSPGTLTHLYVVLQNWTSPFSAVDFQIEYPPELTWLADELPYPPGMVSIGDSPGGIAIAWGTCCMPDVEAGPVLLLTPLVMAGQGCNCGGGGVAVHGYAPLGKQNPTVVRYPDFTEFPVEGTRTFMCRLPVAVESSTWGSIKALYR